MVFILQFVNVVYHVDCSVVAETPCIPGINPMRSWCMYDSFNISHGSQRMNVQVVCNRVRLMVQSLELFLEKVHCPACSFLER